MKPEPALCLMMVELMTMKAEAMWWIIILIIAAFLVWNYAWAAILLAGIVMIGLGVVMIWDAAVCGKSKP